MSNTEQQPSAETPSVVNTSPVAAHLAGALSRRVRVWDLPIRVFHWSLLLLMSLSWLSVEQSEWFSASLLQPLGLSGDAIEWHARFGYCLLALLVFRIGWGIFGSETARFSTFLRSPRLAFAHLQHLLRREHHPVAGHNPAGGWMVVLMLLLIASQISTGLFANDDVYFEAPLAAWVGSDWSSTLTGWHGDNFDLLLVSIVLHILAIIFYKVWAHDALVPPMITGCRQLPQSVPMPFMQKAWPGMVWAICCAGLLWWIWS